MGSREEEEERYFSISHYRINGVTFENGFRVINLVKRTNYPPPLSGKALSFIFPLPFAFLCFSFLSLFLSFFLLETASLERKIEMFPTVVPLEYAFA